MLPLTHEETNSFSSAGALGPFRVLHQIGVGVLGPVFRTYEHNHGRLVAVKVFRLNATPEQATALADELNRVVELELEHPSIVRPIAAGVAETLAYLAQEYVAGESLDVAMRHYAPAPLDKALPFITQLASALDLAHAAGVTHGALHPRDVFMTPDEARATGFGVVPALERVGLHGPIRRPYSAPERIAGERWGPAADIFALAAIAFELLTGRRPAGTGDQVVAQLEIGGAADLDALRRAFADALADDPGRRPASAQAFAHGLARAAAGKEGVTLGAPDGFVQVTPPARGQSPAASQPERSLDFGPLEPVEERWTENVPRKAGKEGKEIDELTDVVAGHAARVADGRVDSGHSEIEPALMGEPGPVSNEPIMTGPEVVIPQLTYWEWPRRAMLPLALTLVVGMLMAFVAGYGLGSRRQAPAALALTDQDLPAAGVAPPAPAESFRVEQERSEGTVERSLADQAPAGPILLSAPPVPPGRSSLSPVTSSLSPVVPPQSPTTAPALASPQPVGRLLVRSSPPGAQVAVNGEPRGATPLALSEVAYGSYTLRVSRSGYEPQVHELSISADQPVGTLALELMPEGAGSASPTQAAGSVFVESRPPGAQVFLDGNLIGRTPILWPDEPVDSHQIRIELDGYQVWSALIRVRASERTRVGASLDRLPRP